MSAKKKVSEKVERLRVLRKCWSSWRSLARERLVMMEMEKGSEGS